MNKIIICVLVISLMISISIYFYNFYTKHVHKRENDKISEVTNTCESKGVTQVLQEKSLSDEDVKFLQDKGWDVHQVRNPKRSRNIRSLASIANCLWRVLNYPYMYNFYPILNFGVGKIMTGMGELINNVHFPLFSSSTATTSQQPMSDSESQAQQLAYAQGQALSQEGTTTPADYTGAGGGGDTSYNSPITESQAKTTSQEYQDEKDEEMEEEKEKEESLRKKLRQQEVNKKIDAKAAILAKKYIQMYFSQNKQQLQDISLSNQNNLLGDANIDLPNSLDNAANPTTDLYDFNTDKNDALPNNVNNLPVYN